MPDSDIPFEPGSYWTPKRARDALVAMIASRDSPEMQAMMETVAAAGAADADPAAAMALLVGEGARPRASAGVIRRESCVFRRGRAGDLPTLVLLIAAGELPPLFLEPFVDGFLVVEHQDRIVGAGGVEMYGEDAVIRSVVVDAEARGLGLGLEIARLLDEDARASGARNVFLFSLHAWRFWLRLGYDELPLDQWPEPVRENWQYQFVARFPEASRDVHAMVKRADPR